MVIIKQIIALEHNKSYMQDTILSCVAQFAQWH